MNINKLSRYTYLEELEEPQYLLCEACGKRILKDYNLKVIGGGEQ